MLSSDAVEYTVRELIRSQDHQLRSDENKKRVSDLRAEIDRLIAAIAAVGHSDALLSNLHARERELKPLEAQQTSRKRLEPEEVRAFVLSKLNDIPNLLAKAPETPKPSCRNMLDLSR
jgi:hypothetical protein